MCACPQHASAVLARMPRIAQLSVWLLGAASRPACADWGGSGSFTQLQTIDLHNNSLTGSLPSTWGQNLNNVTYLDLSANLLAGTVPAGAPVI